jgi:AcrR family transcriptional regulator
MAMSGVDWTALRNPGGDEPEAEGLRERKKRLMRRQLSDTATAMFLERGFDAVRVSEIAAACGVSEKTVFNYFPTKESLILDLGETTLDALRSGLADPDLSPVDATLRVLAGELDAVTDWLAGQDDRAAAVAAFRRFGSMIASTPALRAYQHDTTARLIAAAAEILANRAGLPAEDPEPQIAATALLGLWPIQFQSLGRHLDGTRTPEQIRKAVTADVHRAARLIADGLKSFAPPKSGLAREMRSWPLHAD